MKKAFLTVFVCLATLVVSCGCKQEKGLKGLLLSENEKIDTLSYIVGMDVANSIEKNMIPFFKVNYDAMMEALVKALDPKATVEVEGESFTKENFREFGDKYMSNEFRERVMAAQNDSTANIYTDEKERNIISAILGADIAYSASNVQFELDNRSLVTAINEIHNGKGRIDEQFAMEYTRNYFTVVVPEKNKKESAEWLAKIEKKKGVKKTESGILYKIEKEGDNNIKAVNFLKLCLFGLRCTCHS
jgi:FKBP-type peptidyl-prolyl cis-trans isomerase FkpA